jgi:hypothetical protein
MKMAKISKDQTGVKMKKLSTIRKERNKLQKFISKNMILYGKDLKMTEKLNSALTTYNTLVWVCLKCAWTPSKLILND